MYPQKDQQDVTDTPANNNQPPQAPSQTSSPPEVPPSLPSQHQNNPTGTMFPDTVSDSPPEVGKKPKPKWHKVVKALGLVVAALLLILTIFVVAFNQFQMTTTTYQVEDGPEISFDFYRESTIEPELGPVVEDGSLESSVVRGKRLVAPKWSGKYPLQVTVFKLKEGKNIDRLCSSDGDNRVALTLSTPSAGQDSRVCGVVPAELDMNHYIYFYEISHRSEKFLMTVSQVTPTTSLEQYDADFDKLAADDELDLRRYHTEIARILESIEIQS